MSGGFGSYNQLSRRVTDLERKIRQAGIASAAGTLAGIGSVTLASDGSSTSTVKTDPNVTASSIILPVASSADGWSVDAGITGITAGAGQFTVTHSASTLARSFNYIVINPA
jgi:hypothetical protein